jgi:hypothetical protein
MIDQQIFDAQVSEVFNRHSATADYSAMYADLKALGFNRVDLHRAYYAITHKLGPELVLEHCTAYQEMAGAYTEYYKSETTSDLVGPPALSTPKAAKLVDQPAGRQEVIDSFSKKISKCNPNWSLERFVEHCYYHLGSKVEKANVKSTSFEDQLAFVKTFTNLEII